MKKLIGQISLFILTFVLSLSGMISLFSGAVKSLYVADASSTPVSRESTNYQNTENSKFESIFGYFSISSANHVYSPYDFVTEFSYDNVNSTANIAKNFKKDQEQYIGAIFTNSTITINQTLQNNPITLHQIGEYNMETFELTDSTEKAVATNLISGKSCYILNINETLTIKKYRIVISATGLTPNYITFVIVQTNNNFSHSNSVSYSYNQGSEINPDFESSAEMQTDKTYSPVYLTVKAGTKINPTYIHFIKNGKNYLIYNIDGNFYNGYDNQILSELNEGIIFNNSTHYNTLPLDQSGIYEVEVYDETLKCNCDKPNLVTDEFLVENSTNPVFLTAETDTGAQVANEETTNDDVTVYFYNLIGNIQSLNVRKSYQSQGGDIYSVDDVKTNNFPTAYRCDEDCIYTFFITKNGQTRETELYTFRVVKDIHASFTPKNQAEILPTKDNGEPDSHDITETANLEYAYGIKNIAEYKYTVRVAKSNPSITGITNGGNVSGSVTLYIYGVGDISVQIIEGGNVKPPQTLKNGNPLTIENAGNYKVIITDEMGVSATKTFTIGVKVNGASIAIIVIGAVLLAGILFFIIRSRSRVSVK